jgi:hypothetical protein
MRILAIEKDVPGVSDERFTPALLKAEATRAWELYQRGTFCELYFRQDREEAVLVLECKDLQEASRIIESLPLVKNHLITFELIPLRPYPGFARLFNGPKEPHQ